MAQTLLIVALVLVGVLGVIPLIVSSFLRNVDAGTIRMVSWLQGSTIIYRGPGKSKEVPLLTTGTTLSSKAINVDLDITDQTADLDRNGTPQPIKVRILASAIVSVGDTDTLIKTAANRFFSKDSADQANILIDLLSSSARRAINLLTHDQLFSAKTAPQLYAGGQTPALGAGSSQGTGVVAAPPRPVAMTHAAEAALQGMEDDDDPLAVIIRKACSRELTDLGLTFNSLNIKVVQSEVAESRRRQSAAEAQANADIVTAQQARRAKEAQLEAERVISDKQRELEQTKASNAALIAEAEAKKQTALGTQRVAELEATQIAQARADAEKMRIGAEASARAEAIRITTVAQANAESIQKVNEAIKAGGESYFRYRQIEMIPQIAPVIADALAKARLITISGDSAEGGAAQSATSNITSVIQTVLAAQLVSGSGMLQGPDSSREKADSPRDNGRQSAPAVPPAPQIPPPAKTGFR
ncbi:MAG: flotillin [Gemmatimonadaceae bacterium]|jgi:flotillin|nr:flotillin [Gemmatimonadaceae bacterium]